MLSGLALRQCIELGLHRKSIWRVKGDVLATEMQRRVFWVAYNLDRSAAFSLGRPLGIPDRDIDVEVGSHSVPRLPLKRHSQVQLPT